MEAGGGLQFDAFSMRLGGARDSVSILLPVCR